MVKGFLVSLLFGAITLVVYLYFYLGAYKPVEFSVAQVGPLSLIFKTHVGPYHQINAKIQEAEAWANEHHLPCRRTFGEFLDDPKGVDEDRLRSHVGCILEGPPPEGSVGDFTFEERPVRRYAVGHFGGSPSIGPFKVYPKLQEFLQRERLASSPDPVIEIYKVNGDEVVTDYLFPLAE